MVVQNRLIGPCVKHEKGEANLVVDLGALIRRLILFDTYILQSVRLLEVPQLVKSFGYRGILSVLSSGGLKFHVDATMPGQIGQSLGLKSRIKKGVLPLGSYSFAMIRPHDRDSYINDCLIHVDQMDFLSLSAREKLKQAILDAIVERPPDYGTDTLDQLKEDISNYPHFIKRRVCKVLFDQYQLIASAENFVLEINFIDNTDISIETNIGIKYSLSNEQVHKVIEKALFGVLGLNQKLEDMKAYSALSGCINDELSIFSEKIGFVLKEISPKSREAQMKRVIEIKSLPQIEGDSLVRIEADKLLKVRESNECKEFRKWLIEISNATDQEIQDQTTNIREKLSSLIHGKKGKNIAFFLIAGLGFIPEGKILSSVAGILNKFLLKKIIPYSAPIMFINQLYPSIFKHAEKKDLDNFEEKSIVRWR